MATTMKLVLCYYSCMASLFLGYVNALLLDARANYCQVCNDDEDGHHCSSPQYTICKQLSPFCMNQYRSHNGQIKVEKRCASKSECHNLWWLETKTNPKCSQTQLSSGNLATGVVCSICCSSRHCNKEEYPVDVLSFPDTAVTPKATTHISQTPQPTTSTARPTTHATTGAAAETTTLQTTRSTETLPKTTEQTGVMSKPQPPQERHTTPFIFPHATGLTEGAHTLLPSAAMCVMCVEDPTEGIECDPYHTRICKHDTRYCMTSYKVKGDSYRIERSCASLDTCRDLWWRQTSTVKQCFENDLLLQKSGSTGSRPPSCHYCCHALGAGAKGARCNDEMDQVIPRQLLMLGPLNITGTTTSNITTVPAASTEPPSTVDIKSTSTSTSTSGTKHRCMICGPAEKNCDATHISECPDERPYCMNTLQVTMNSHRVVSKGCASDLECYSGWWEVTRNKADCAGDLSSVHLSKHGLICSWCCNTSSADKPCNRDERPAKLLDYTPPTTTSLTSTTITTTIPTTTLTTTSTIPTTTTSTTTSSSRTTTAKGNSKCISCTSSDKTCDLSNLTECPDETPFCMNTLEISSSGHRVVKKKCASDLECYSEWWEVTRNKADCAGDLSSVHLSKHGLICSWCCNASWTDKPCNRDERPAKLLDYTPPTTTSSTTSTTITTTIPTTTSTTTTSTTSTTTSSSPTTTDNMKNVCIACVSGDVTCDVTHVKECPEEEPFCMNTLEVTGSGHRVVRKKCASDLECYSEWWEVTRNKADCAGDLSSVHLSKHGLICSWCCSNSSPLKPCNHGDRPTALLNYTEGTSTTKPQTTESATGVFNTTTLPTVTVNATQSSNLTSTIYQHTPANPNITSMSVTVNNTTSTSGSSNPFETTTNLPPVTSHVTHVNTTSTPSGHASVSSGMTSSNISSVTSSPMLPTNGTTSSAVSSSRNLSTTQTTSLAPTNASSTHTIQCWDCDNGCPFIQSAITCPDFCLTTVIDDTMYTRTIRKRCVNFDECKELWWLQTSDVSVCTGMLHDSTYPTGVDVECNFCCTTDDCNKDAFPSKETLFNGYKSYPNHG